MSCIGESAVTCRAPTMTVPAVAVSSPPMMLRRVVFPLPLGPIMATTSLSLTDMLSPRSA